MLVANVRPPNSLVLIGDPSGELPNSMERQLVSATTSRIAIGTKAQADGETRIKLSGPGEEAKPLSILAFEGQLRMNGCRLTVESVLGTEYLHATVDGSSASLEIWVDDSHEPSEIHVVLNC